MIFFTVITSYSSLRNWLIARLEQITCCLSVSADAVGNDAVILLGA